MAVKPMIFNADMIQALRENRKTVTRRIVNQSIVDKFVISENDVLLGSFNPLHSEWGVYPALDDAPYQPGDILYVPEAWRGLCSWVKGVASPRYGYAVKFKDGEETEFYFGNAERAKKWRKYLEKPKEHWQSPYFMPREAARIFLRVTGIRVERLQDITEHEAKREGALLPLEAENDLEYADYIGGYYSAFGALWDSTIKPADRAVYGWAANPWAWVIEFECCDKPRGWPNG